MRKEYPSIKELIKANLIKKEVPDTIEVINKLKEVKRRGYLTKEEFLAVCMWKSPRPKQRYLENTEEKIKTTTKKVLSTKFEKRKIELLTELRGVSIPVASAILTITNPRDYGIIDIRVWQLLYFYEEVKTKPRGAGFNFNNWYSYLMKLRFLARELKVSVRDVERTLFYYHKTIQEGNLYK